MTRGKVSFGRLLGNNKVAFVISFVLAVLIWIVITMQFSSSQEVTFQDIPVTIDTTMTDNLQLKIFGQTEYTVSVKVSGKRYEVSSAVLSADDFQVTASAANVATSGKHTLPLNVKMKNSGNQVEILSYTPDSIEVFFDHTLTQNYEVMVDIDSGGQDIAADGYVSGDVLPSVAEVTVSGAATEVEKISKVVAKVKLEEPLTTTTKYENTPLTIINQNNGVARSTYIRVEDGITAVTVTVPILKVMQLSPSIRFKNQPSYFVSHPISLAWYPSGSVEAAVSTELLDKTDILALGTVDFASIGIGVNTFTFDAKDIPNIRILDDSIEQFSVHFTVDGFQSRKIVLPGEKISFNNVPADMELSIPEGTQLELIVIGTQTELDAINEDSILATVDASGLDGESETAVLPVNCVVDNTTTCWVFGSHTVAVAIR